LAACAPARVSALKSEDLPAFGRPTMPIFMCPRRSKEAFQRSS
jgi:hypothetical protein